MLRLRSSSEPLVGPTELAERDAILYAHGGGFIAGGGSTYAGFAALDRRGDRRRRLPPRLPARARASLPGPGRRPLRGLPGDPRARPRPSESRSSATPRAPRSRSTSPWRSPRWDCARRPRSCSSHRSWTSRSPARASSSNARRDPMLSIRFLERGARAHAAGLRLTDPQVSPLFADLGALPPTLVQVGTDEVLLDDSTRFADRAWAAGRRGRAAALRRHVPRLPDRQLNAEGLARSAGRRRRVPRSPVRRAVT